MWETKDVLICIKTYPEYSKKYDETVCTAGIRKDTGGFIRLYPIPYRYLDGEKQFKKYQWIQASIEKSSDERPESHKVNASTIKTGAVIGPEREWAERRRWVLTPGNVYSSMKDLQEQQKNTGASLGLIKPRKVSKLSIVKKSDAEMQEAEEKKKTVMAQTDMFKDKHDLDIVPYKFVLTFECDSEDGSVHNMSILDWEILQLYRNLRGDPKWKDKVREKVLTEIFASDRETYLFMGNMARWQHVFCILGFFWPKKRQQLSLFS